MAEKSYFYVFIRDEMTPLDKAVKEAFVDLSRLFPEEVEVRVYTPSDSEFRHGLQAFEIVQWPGFALSDQLYDLSVPAAPNPYSHINRLWLEERRQDEILNFVQDLHEAHLREGLLKMKLRDAEKRLAGILNITLDTLARVAAIVTPFLR